MNNYRSIIVIILILFLFPMLIFLGCSKINQKNFDKLKAGMEYDEVLKILGKPDNCESVLNMKNCTWEESPKNIKILIFADKVVLLSSQGIQENVRNSRQIEYFLFRFEILNPITLIPAVPISSPRDFCDTISQPEQNL